MPVAWVTWDVTVAHTMATSYVWQNTLQAGSAAEAASVSRPSTVRSPPRHMFFSGGGRDSWSLVRRGSQPRRRDRQKSRALHSRCARNYVPVPTYFLGNSAFERIAVRRSQFPSPHHNHSGHILPHLLILRPIAKISINK